jgi:hypothetical protein
MIRFANLEAEAALWASYVNVSTLVMGVFRHLLPKFVAAQSTAVSKVCRSFDSWSAKGDKRDERFLVSRELYGYSSAVFGEIVIFNKLPKVSDGRRRRS